MKLADLFVKLGLQKGEFDKGIDDAKRKTNVFGSAMKSIGGIIGAAFATQTLINFGKELIQLNGEVAGVEAAFKRIGSARDLENLRQSTKGTVNDLNLMKRAVMASNFGIPIQQLGKLFEFAAKRAQDTGQSVDYLVDSIVMGIGRKSPLILDNLGISAVQLKEKLGSVAMETASVGDIAQAVGKIAAESLSSTGGLLDTTATKTAQLTTQWENLKIEIAKTDVVTGLARGGMELLAGVVGTLELGLKSLKTGFGTFIKLIMGNLAGATTDIARAQVLQEEADELNKKSIKTTEKKTVAIEDETKAKERAKKAQDELNASIKEQQRLDEAYINYMSNVATKGTRADFLIGATKSGKQEGAKTGEGIQEWAGNLDEESIEAVDLEFDKALKRIAEKKEKLQQFGDDLKNIVMGSFMEGADLLEDTFKQIAAGDFNWDNFFGSVISQIGKFLATLGKMFIAYGVAELSFFKSLAAGPAGAVTLIAAGAALVAIGGAISGFGQRASGGNISGSGGGTGGFSVTSSSYPRSDRYGEQKHFYDFSAVLKGDDIWLSTKRNGLKRSMIG